MINVEEIRKRAEFCNNLKNAKTIECANSRYAAKLLILPGDVLELLAAYEAARQAKEFLTKLENLE